MYSAWTTFLTDQGGVPGAAGIQHFGEPERELRAAVSGDICCDLSSRGLIAVAGEEAESFLQGQFTNDIRQVTPTHSQLSGYCTPKGRLLASMRVFQRDDTYYLSLPGERVEPILRRLRMFVLRSKVKLDDASAQLVHIGLAGPSAQAMLEDAVGTAPTAIDDVSQSRGVSAIRLPDAQPRYEIYGPLEELQTLWTAWQSRSITVGEEAWRLLDIMAGIPTIYTATAEAFVPQMVNLDLMKGVNFRKGCYVGQEIIARSHHLGTTKRRMYRAHVNGTTPPQVGAGLFSPQGESDREVGQIADTCRHPDGGYEVLAVVLIDCVEDGSVRLGNLDGPVLAFSPTQTAFDHSSSAP